MKNIKVVLYNTKKYNAENIDDVQILENENNATTIEVQFPVEYEDYSKRVEFQNIKGEKWTTSLYAPEDERNQYDENFDKLNFRFTIPSAMTKRGELKVQLIAYLADGTNTIVPFQVIVLTIDNSILYATKEGKENPELIIRAYEYANMALEISRDAFSRIENAERAALEAEASAESAQNSATSAQNSATNAENSAKSANTRALNAEASAESAQNSAEYAESVADEANTKSNNAVSTANGANTKSDNAISTANTALANSNTAVTTANTANTKASNAVTTSNSANTKSDNAVTIASEAKEIAEEANEISTTANTKSDSAVASANSANTKSDNAVSTANSANTKSDNAVKTASEAKTSATNAVNTANSANTKSDNAVSTANSANTKSTNAVDTANEALATAEEALNQVVEKMGTKVYFGSNTTPEINVSFNSDPQTQITTNANEITKIIDGTTTVKRAEESQKLMSKDTRSINSTPLDYMSNQSKQVITEFKTTSTIGVSSLLTASTYCQIITIIPWTDSSGGYPVQIAFNGSGIAYRVGTADSTWGSWNKLSTVAELTEKCDNLQTQINNMLNGTTTFTLLKANVVDLV